MGFDTTKTVGCKWVFKKKIGADGSVESHKGKTGDTGICACPHCSISHELKLM